MKRMSWLSVIMVLSLVVGIAFGKSDVGLKGIGAKIGYIMPENPIDNTFGFGAVANLGKLSPKINFEAELLYWSKGYSESYFKWSYSQIYISAFAKYFFPQKKGAKWLPYAGGGLGLVIGKVKSEYTGEPIYGIHGSSSSESNTDLGIHFLGGVKTKLSPTMDGFAELRYSIDGADFFGFFIGTIFK
ncbi:MAG TPA: hypothetical protein VGB38_09330, partial [bacterium]